MNHVTRTDDEESESLMPNQINTIQSMPVDKLLASLNTSIDGLSRAKSKAAREMYNLNIIPPPLNIPEWLCCLLPCLTHTTQMELFHECIPDYASVKRDNLWKKLDVASIVPGDIVKLSAQCRAPADIRVILATSNCKFDKTALVGTLHPEPQYCVPHESSPIYLESPNMIFASDLCIEGECTGVVVATGVQTVIAKLISKGKWPIQN